ncbi:MAG: SH3 domain-containing protein [Pseudomonadota bacterium]
MSAKRSIRATILTAIAALSISGGAPWQPALAQGSETPFWKSLKYDQVRMRVGPSREYPIEWLYGRKGLPVKVVRVREGWSLVQDPDGAQGWIADSQLTATRSVLVIGEGLAPMREEPANTSALRWRAEPGVVGQLLRCREGWCEISVTGRSGWVDAEQLWGDEDLASQE